MFVFAIAFNVTLNWLCENSNGLCYSNINKTVSLKKTSRQFCYVCNNTKKYVKIKHGLVKPLKPYNVVNFKLIWGRLVIQKIPN